VPVDALELTTVANSPKDIDLFEPKGKVAEDKKLVMGYVVAYDAGTCSQYPLLTAERFAKDVTVRYVKNFPGKAKRWRTREFSVRGASGETVMYDWFKRTLGILRRTETTVYSS
jgi:xeroderma pigmentosum group C-complementing protein